MGVFEKKSVSQPNDEKWIIEKLTPHPANRRKKLSLCYILLALAFFLSLKVKYWGSKVIVTLPFCKPSKSSVLPSISETTESPPSVIRHQHSNHLSGSSEMRSKTGQTSFCWET